MISIRIHVDCSYANPFPTGFDNPVEGMTGFSAHIKGWRKGYEEGEEDKALFDDGISTFVCSNSVSSSVGEMGGIYLALKHLQTSRMPWDLLVEYSDIVVFCDNINVVHTLNSGTTRCPWLAPMLLYTSELAGYWSELLGVPVTFKHKPREHADMRRVDAAAKSMLLPDADPTFNPDGLRQCFDELFAVSRCIHDSMWTPKTHVNGIGKSWHWTPHGLWFKHSCLDCPCWGTLSEQATGMKFWQFRAASICRSTQYPPVRRQLFWKWGSNVL